MIEPMENSAEELKPENGGETEIKSILADLYGNWFDFYDEFKPQWTKAEKMMQEGPDKEAGIEYAKTFRLFLEDTRKERGQG
jgi:hypothetical protein